MLDLKRSEHRITPDAGRLVSRPFLPGAFNFGGDLHRLERIVERILALAPEAQGRLLDEALARSAGRFRDIESRWLANYDLAAERVPVFASVEDPDLRRLIGSYLTLGYAYEAAALTNPSIVQVGEAHDGLQPFVMSARAIGEGHISSVAFLTGSAGPGGEIQFDPRSPYADNGDRMEPTYRRRSFTHKLSELGFANEVSNRILSHLPEEFNVDELRDAIADVQEADLDPILVTDTIRMIHWLSDSSYEVVFDEDTPLTERLISPAAPSESRGMEDARFVRFVDEDGKVTYYATYTAFDGIRILPQLIETADFRHFRMSTMSGPTAYHKGLALFPRKVDGEYAAVSRHDQETTFVMRSDNLRHWGNAEAVLVPEQGWEAVQTGNCGSPLETEAGWLLITHGVGPMRRYVLGAVLLDLDEPTKLVGRLTAPLLEPLEGESIGYVPDVVYSCGGMIVDDLLILPYGYADYGIRVATVPVSQILAEMV
jgi:predicted GH43/DUF377 family glycosyl hydrolase